MEFFVTTTAAARQRTDCAIVGVYDKGVLSAGADAIDARIGKRIARLIERGDVRGKSGEGLLLADVTGGPCEPRPAPATP
jgi:leucyl aminopeptidase